MVSGMGIVKRNNSKCWYIQFRLNGKMYVSSTKTTDRKLAEQIEVKFKNDILHGQVFGTRERIKVADLVEKFLLVKQHLASHSHYQRYGTRIIREFGRDVTIDTLTIREIDRFRQSLISSGQRPATTRHYLNFLRSMFGYAKEIGCVVPDVEVRSIKQTAGRLRYLSMDEEKRLLASLDPTREIQTRPSYDKRSPHMNRDLHNTYDFVVTLLDTGARHSEIATLEWSSIDLGAKTIRLWRPKVRNQSILYMTERLHRVLQRRYDVRDQSIPFVFHSVDGRSKPYCQNTARRIFDRVGLSDCSFHTLRHTHATRLIQHGLTIYEVKEILGHTDIKTTMRYAHLERTNISMKAKEVLDAISREQVL
jgi:integrase